MGLNSFTDEKEQSKSLSKSVSNEKIPGSEKIDICCLLISFEMGCMAAKLSRFGSREYRVRKGTVDYDIADLDSDPDFVSDSDEINPDIQKTSLVAEFSCHQFTGGIDFNDVSE